MVERVRNRAIRAGILTLATTLAAGIAGLALDLGKSWIRGRIDQAFTNQAAAQDMGPQLATPMEIRVDSLETRVETLEGDE